MKDKNQIPPQSKKEFEFIENILVEDDNKFDSNIYVPVHCCICDNQVGYLEKLSEVFHFFNVIPSD